MTSLKEYAAIDQTRFSIELHWRHVNDSWITHTFDSSQEDLEYESAGLTIKVDEIYRRVTFVDDLE
jgi:hypothetical protein